MTWRAWSSDADGGVRTSILTAQTTPAPDLTRRVTPQNPRSQHYHHDFAEALGATPGRSPSARSAERPATRGVRSMASQTQLTALGTQVPRAVTHSPERRSRQHFSRDLDSAIE